MVRIKKKEIEQDKFITYSMNALNWVKDNSQTVFAILIGIALGLAVIFFYRSYKAESKQASIDLLNEADAMYYKNVTSISQDTFSENQEPVISDLNSVELEEAISNYDELIEEYPSSNSATFALLNKGNAAFLAKKFEIAIESYKEFLGRNFDSPLNEIAQENLIAAFIEKKDYASAAKEIKKFVKKSRRDEFKSKLLFRLGNIYELQKDIPTAIETYKKITEEYSETSISNKASSQIKLIESKEASSSESEIKLED